MICINIVLVFDDFWHQRPLIALLLDINSWFLSLSLLIKYPPKALGAINIFTALISFLFIPFLLYFPCLNPDFFLDNFLGRLKFVCRWILIMNHFCTNLTLNDLLLGQFSLRIDKLHLIQRQSNGRFNFWWNQTKILKILPLWNRWCLFLSLNLVREILRTGICLRLHTLSDI